MIDLEHSPLGGSGAHRFLKCTAAFLLHREELRNGTFEEIVTDFAERGTAAHEIASDALTTDLEPFEFLGEDFNGFKAGWPDGVDLNAVQIYVNECRSILDATAADPRTVYIERTIHRPDIHPLFKGTVDFGVRTPKGFWLRDYKNGEGIGVAATMSAQLLYYAALLISEAQRENPQGFPVDMPVSLGIVQPNFYGVFEDADVWVTTVGFVMDWLRDTLLPRMRYLFERQELPTEDEHVPGEHCQFCPVLLDCVKMRRAYETFANASEDFIAMLTNEELNAYYEQREYARRFMKALDNTVYARKVAGGNIPSAKLVEKQTARVWKPGGVAAIQAALGDAAFKPREPLSPAGVEKVSSQGKALALEYGYKPTSAGLTIAPLTDRRPEAKHAGNARVFEHIAAAAMQDF